VSASIILAVLGLLGALAPLLVAWFNRRVDPSPAQRSDEISAEFRELEAQIAELERRGDFAAADALRVQLITRVEAERVAGAGHGDGQQLPPAAAGGDDDHGAR
jgi:hypothetical protein